MPKLSVLLILVLFTICLHGKIYIKACILKANLELGYFKNEIFKAMEI